MKPIKSFLAFCVFAFLQPCNVFATDKIEHIEVVHSTDVSKLHSQLLSADDLVDKATVLSDVLSDLSGVQIRRSGGLGGNSSISVRGSSNQQVNVYIDGQLVNSAQSGGFDLDLIPLALIESVELIQAQSSGAGLTPIGGELHIRTKRGDGNQTTLTLAAGSFGFIEGSAKQSIELSDHQLTASISWLESDNDYSYPVPQSFANSQVSVAEPLKNNRFEKLSLFVSDVWPHDNGASDLVLQYTEQSKQLPNYQNNSPENTSKLDEDNLRFGWQQKLNTSSRLIPAWQWRLGHFDQKETYYDRRSLTYDDEYLYDTEQQFFEISSPIVLENWRVEPSVKYDSQSFESFSLVNQQQIRCNGITSCDVLAEQTQWLFAAAIKWQSKNTPWQANYSSVWVDDNSSNETLHKEFGDKIESNNFYRSQQLNFGRYWQNHKFSAQFSEGIRVPTMFERFGDRGLFKGNSNLEPEESKGVAVSSQHDWQLVNFGTFSFEQSLYYQDVENSIVAIFNSSGIGSYTNVSAVTLSGWSVKTKQEFDHIAIGFNADVLDSETKSEFRAFNRKKQPGVYHQQYHLYANWQVNDLWALRIDWHHDRDVYFDRANKISSNNGLTSNRTLTDVSLNYSGTQMSGSLHLNNIFNQEFLDLANRAAVGREIRLSITFKEF